MLTKLYRVKQILFFIQVSEYRDMHVWNVLMILTFNNICQSLLKVLELHIYLLQLLSLDKSWIMGLGHLVFEAPRTHTKI
jgi:hypothetical protein